MKVLVIFESSRGRTKAMAEAICEGVKSEGVECEVVEAKKFSGLNSACALAVGSSTRMKRTLPRLVKSWVGWRNSMDFLRAHLVRMDGVEKHLISFQTNYPDWVLH